MSGTKSDSGGSEMSEWRDSYGLNPGDVYVPDGGEHEGHRVTIIADHMPAIRLGRVAHHGDRWVECECGERWTFTRPEADDAAKDADGWPV